MKTLPRLGVNIDHIATVRNARGGDEGIVRCAHTEECCKHRCPDNSGKARKEDASGDQDGRGALGLIAGRGWFVGGAHRDLDHATSRASGLAFNACLS